MKCDLFFLSTWLWTNFINMCLPASMSMLFAFCVWPASAMPSCLRLSVCLSCGEQH